MSEYIDKLFLSGQEIPIRDSNAQEKINELSNKQDNIKSVFLDYNAVDICAPLPRPASEVYAGITMTNNGDDTFTFSGTATGTFYENFFYSPNSFPLGMKPGEEYSLIYSGSKVAFKVFAYRNGGLEDMGSYFSNATIPVPSDATGILLRFHIGSGTANVNETVAWPKLMTALTNKELEEKVEKTLPYLGTLPTASDLNDITATSSYLVADGLTYDNLPVDHFAGVLDTRVLSRYVTTQMATEIETGKRYYRIRSGATPTWKSWIALDEEYFGTLPNGSNLNNISETSIYLVADGLAYYNKPTDNFVGVINTQVLSRYATTQTATEFETGRRYYRIKSGANPTWKSWLILDNNPLYAVSGKYVAFGDSVTWGAIWDLDQTTSLYQADIAYQIPTRIAVATGMENNFVNEGEGGTGYYNQGDTQSVTDKIKAYDFTGVDLVTIMAGVNDKPLSDHPLGTAANPASGTICGAIKSIIDWFSENYPAVQLVIIQPTPSGHLADPWNGVLEAGWSLNSFNAEVSKLCEAEHVGYVNWNDCTLCKNWDSFSGGYHKTQAGTVIGPNYSHMTNERDLMLIGDYIGAKVASFHHGKN